MFIICDIFLLDLKKLFKLGLAGVIAIAGAAGALADELKLNIEGIEEIKDNQQPRPKWRGMYPAHTINMSYLKILR